MTQRAIILIIVLIFSSRLAMARADFFDKSVRTGIKPDAEEFREIYVDTLSVYFDSLYSTGMSRATNKEIYRVTFESYQPPQTRIKYFILSGQTLTSIEVVNDGGKKFARKRFYGGKLVAMFRPLIDSTYWSYHEPVNQSIGPVQDGWRTKIEGVRNSDFKDIERTNPTKYDTLFRLPESFFRRY